MVTRRMDIIHPAWVAEKKGEPTVNIIKRELHHAVPYFALKKGFGKVITKSSTAEQQ